MKKCRREEESESSDSDTDSESSSDNEEKQIKSKKKLGKKKPIKFQNILKKVKVSKKKAYKLSKQTRCYSSNKINCRKYLSI